MRQGYTESLKRLLQWLRVPKMAGMILVVVLDRDEKEEKNYGVNH